MADDPWAVFSPKSAADDPWAQFKPQIMVKPPLETSEISADVAKSIGGAGLPNLVANTAGLPGDIGSLIAAGAGAVGVPPQVQSAIGSAAKYVPGAIGAMAGPTSQELKQKIEEATGPLYKPQTPIGSLAATMTEMTPALAFPGSAAMRAANVVAPALASEAAGLAAGGDPMAKAAAGMAGAAAPATLARNFPRIGTNALALRAVPKAEDLKSSADALYTAARQTGLTLAPDSFDKFAQDLLKTAHNAGIDPTLHPGANAALGRVWQARDTPVDLEKLDTLRQIIKDAGASQVPGERRVAGIMREKLDNYMDGLKQADVVSGDPQQAVPMLTEARGLWSRMRKGELVDDAVERAKLSAPNFSASGYENALRTEFRRIAKNDKIMRTLSDEEQDAIKNVAKGGVIENTLRMAGKFAPMGPVSAGTGGVLAHLFGGPAAIPAVWGAGLASRLGATAMTAKNAELAGALMRSGGGQIPGYQGGLPTGEMAWRAMLAKQLLERPQEPQ